MDDALGEEAARHCYDMVFADRTKAEISEATFVEKHVGTVRTAINEKRNASSRGLEKVMRSK